MHWISNYTSTGSGGAVFFNSIPQTFTHLQFRLSIRTPNAGASTGVYIPGNAYHNILGSGATATSYGASSLTNGIFTGIGNSSTANVFSSHIVDILDYTNTSKNKTVKVIGGYDANGSGYVELHSTLINSTTAISSFFFDVGGSGFSTGSSIDLYGITSNPIATGA
jgi:hypothetical protein